MYGKHVQSHPLKQTHVLRNSVHNEYEIQVPALLRAGGHRMYETSQAEAVTLKLQGNINGWTGQSMRFSLAMLLQ